MGKKAAAAPELRTIGQRSDNNIKTLKSENKSSLHRIDKKQVSLKAAEGDGSVVGASMVPSEVQLEAINSFTRVEATADNVRCFSTMACNDLYDRDDERFSTECVKAFSSLPAPYSPVGKSYMLDHEYKIANVRGRIFETSHKAVEGVRFLTCGVYVPNTPQYHDFLESIDFGLNWAVSVGVVIDKTSCSICKAPVYSSRFFGSWCDNGHEKGYFYVPGQEEDDGWGFFLPVDPATKGATKAMVDMDDPIDFYELSQVFLGAQYMAELAKEPSFKSVMKAAKASVVDVPVIGLSHKEAERLPLPREPEQVSEARHNFNLTSSEDGTYRWVDGSNLVWTYAAGELLCLGKQAASVAKSASDEERSAEIRKSVEAIRERVKASDTDEDDDPKELAQALDATLDEIEDALDAGEYDQADDLLTAAEATADSLIEALGGVDADEEGSGDGSADDKVAAARTALQAAQKALEEAQANAKKGTDADGNSDTDGDAPATGHSHKHTHDDGTEHSHSHTHSAGNYDHDGSDPEVTHAHSHDSGDTGDGGKGATGDPASVRDKSEAAPEPSSLLKAAKAAKLPMDVIEAWTDDTLESLLSECSKSIRAARKEADELRPKAELGQQAITDAESDALHWYTMAHRDPKNPGVGVNVELASKLIKRCDGDVALIKELTEEWRATARKLFPQAVRRSTVESDHNERRGPTEVPAEMRPEVDSNAIRRLHG